MFVFICQRRDGIINCLFWSFLLLVSSYHHHGNKVLAFARSSPTPWYNSRSALLTNRGGSLNDNKKRLRLFQQKLNNDDLSPPEEIEVDASEKKKENGGGGDRDRSNPNLFEKFVRSTTNRKDYKFGDIVVPLAKTAVETSKETVENVVRDVTGNEEYEFGDYTKQAVSTVTRPIGGLFSLSDKALHAIRQTTIEEVAEFSDFIWSGTMTPQQRRVAVVLSIYLGAVAILTYNFIHNINAAMIFITSWVITSKKLGVSPITSLLGEGGIIGSSTVSNIAATTVTGASSWSYFLKVHSSLKIFLDGPLLPARAILTVFLFRAYRRYVGSIVHAKYKFPLRKNYPVINRSFSVLMSWIIANILFVNSVSLIIIWLLSKFITGVPMLPTAAPFFKL